jgi:hypothetical protein
VKANLLAPNGTVLMNNSCTIEGAIFARTIVLAGGVQVTMNSAFAAKAPGSASAQKANGNGSESLQAVPEAFALEQNYPNPFNPTTQIRYALPQESHVSLTVYNMLGEEVAQLVNAVQPEGYYEVRWDGRNNRGVAVSTGVYIYRISAGNFVQTMKMVLLK